MKGSKELVLEYLEQELLKNNNRGLNTKEIATGDAKAKCKYYLESIGQRWSAP